MAVYSEVVGRSDFGLNNLIAREVSPHAVNSSVQGKFNRDGSPNQSKFEPVQWWPERSNSSAHGRDTPSTSGRDTPSSSNGRETPVEKTSKFTIWPSFKKTVNGLKSPEVDMKLSASHSVPALRRQNSTDSMASSRAGGLTRRRKVSVPELGLTTMTTVQEKSTDSPTIPGRFPSHERSNSAPGQSIGRTKFVNIPTSKLSPIVDPSFHSRYRVGGLLPSPFENDEPLPSSKSIKRASSILLPDDTDVTILPTLPQTTFSPTEKIDFLKVTKALKSPGSDAPPAVPPKSPRLRLRTQLGPTAGGSGKSIAQRVEPVPQNPSSNSLPENKVSPNVFTHPLTTIKTYPDTQNKSVSGSDRAESPATSAAASPFSQKTTPTSTDTAMTTPSSATTMRLSRSNSVSNLQRSRSNSGFQNFSYRHRKEDSEGSVLDRGRPTKRIEGLIKRKLGTRYAGAEEYATLPAGCSSLTAPSQLPCEEVEALHRQARSQAEGFEVLKYSDVKELSRELRSLDERCEYLRKTHLSLREGRHNLHTRMITYLKSPRLSKFSRESILKQEEALCELDKSIDEWIIKLEYAENRRARVRQKLLEHVAAALMLPSDKLSAGVGSFNEEQTPPRSPEKAESPHSLDRQESIKIYAGSEVYALLADIEHEIESMVDVTSPIS